ncbi:MAG: hypothetical protein IJY82_01695 [Oscillospiraceae bacterium]|nr:hypothetical protein [Oscillospiraceae bacterium]
MMKKVYICAPLGGDVESNLERVKRYTRYALMCGTAPVVPHFYALCLDDNDQTEREIGLAAGLGMLWFCDELWVFGQDITEGMKQELQFCKHLNIKTRYVSEKEIRKKIGGIKHE